MKLIDTTSERAHQGVRALLSTAGAARSFGFIERFRFRLVGIYFSEFGREWDSGGKRESDFLHHIDISLAGRRQVVWQDKVVALEPGMAYFLPGNIPVQRRCDQRCEVLFIKFRCEWLPGVDPLLDWPDRRPLCIGACDTAAWREWLAADFQPGANALLELQGRVELWMARVLPDLDALIGRHLESHIQFTDVFRMIEDKLGARLRINDLARVHGTGRDAFSLAFTRATGLPPKEYLKRRINQQAIELVINSDLKIKEIADKLGFSDEFYFSRFFLKLNGAAPAIFRRRFRTGA